HASTTDLIHWEHHPLALAITEPWEGSICTGSAFFHAGTYYAFYATRRPDWTQHLGVATSSDGATFVKQSPLASPGPRYSRVDYRDPFVFRDPETELFHMLVTSALAEPPLHGYGGCLAHLTSADLGRWEVQEPFLLSSYPGAPECPDLFEWNGWWYLVFSHGLVAHYRMARGPLGPWQRPDVDTFDGAMAAVMKTAPFGPDRRLGVAWVGTREGDLDRGRRQWGGALVIRELIQHPNGTLGSRFVPELVPSTEPRLALSAQALTDHVLANGDAVALTASLGIEAAMLSGVPRDAHITLRIEPGGAHTFGLKLRGSGAFASGCDLRFSPAEARVSLGDVSLPLVRGLDRPFLLDIVTRGDLIDVCIDTRNPGGQRCLINRLPESAGDRLFLYAQDGPATFSQLAVRMISL
ncbi:MAG: family 43 glycosylhydrolase, partial [Anaerolineae bacterium]|nr:family 43 glycosylhydrolase [Anaerolineae bacterium]